MNDPKKIVEELYDLVKCLPLFDCHTPICKLPENGIYLFYEDGEKVRIENKEYDRIVYVGKSDDLRFRIFEHYYGTASTFREHLSNALRVKGSPNSNGCNKKLKKMVTNILMKSLSFSCFYVGEENKRKELEKGLIALLAQNPLDNKHSENWLGIHSDNQIIRDSGLWNVQNVKGISLTINQFEELKIQIMGFLDSQYIVTI